MTDLLRLRKLLRPYIWQVLLSLLVLLLITAARLVVPTIIGNVIDNILMGKKARESGASWFSIGTGYVVSLVISFFFTPIAGLAAAPVGVFLVEFIRRRKWREALNVAWSLMVGWGWSIATRITIGVVMIGLWMIWAWL